MAEGIGSSAQPAVAHGTGGDAVSQAACYKAAPCDAECEENGVDEDETARLCIQELSEAVKEAVKPLLQAFLRDSTELLKGQEERLMKSIRALAKGKGTSESLLSLDNTISELPNYESEENVRASPPRQARRDDSTSPVRSPNGRTAGSWRRAQGTAGRGRLTGVKSMEAARARELLESLKVGDKLAGPTKDDTNARGSFSGVGSMSKFTSEPPAPDQSKSKKPKPRSLAEMNNSGGGRSSVRMTATRSVTEPEVLMPMVPAPSNESKWARPLEALQDTRKRPKGWEFLDIIGGGTSRSSDDIGGLARRVLAQASTRRARERVRSPERSPAPAPAPAPAEVRKDLSPESLSPRTSFRARLPPLARSLHKTPTLQQMQQHGTGIGTGSTALPDTLQRVTSEDSIAEVERQPSEVSLRGIGLEANATPSGFLNFEEDRESEIFHRIHVRLEEQDVIQTPRLGVDVEEREGKGVLLRDIQEGGLIDCWNKRNADSQLRAGDWIIEVNGQTDEMLALLARNVTDHQPLDIVAVHEGNVPGWGQQGSSKHIMANQIREESSTQLMVNVIREEEHQASSTAREDDELQDSPEEGDSPVRSPEVPMRLARSDGDAIRSVYESDVSPKSFSPRDIFNRVAAPFADVSSSRRHRTLPAGGEQPRGYLSEGAAHHGSRERQSSKDSDSGVLPETLQCRRVFQRCGTSEPVRAYARSATTGMSSPSVRRRVFPSQTAQVVPTVQTWRQQREKCLVETLVNRESCASSQASDEVDFKEEAILSVSMPLWLCICSILPWERGCWQRRSRSLMKLYRLFVLVVMMLIICFFVFSLIYFQVSPCEPEFSHKKTCMGYSQMTDLSLAIGSLLALLALRSLARSGILGSSEALLVSYARRQEITEAWSSTMSRNGALLALLWACSVILRGLTLWQRGPVTLIEKVSACSYAISSLVFMGVMHGILHVSCALTMIIDSYVVHFDERFKLERSVYEWNLLQSVLRQVSAVVEKGFLVLQSTALALVLLGASHMYHGNDGVADVAWMCSSAVLVVGVIFIFFKAAEVSERCMRLPALINSLDFGKHVDTRRHYLVEFVTYSAAGFYVGEVRLTTAIALKLTYFGAVVAFAGLSQLYYTTESA